MSVDFANYTRTAAVTTEQLIYAGRCVLFGFFCEVVSTGAITIRNTLLTDGTGPVVHIAASGLPINAAKNFGDQRGILLTEGLTIQTAAATDRCLVKWAPV